MTLIELNISQIKRVKLVINNLNNRLQRGGGGLHRPQPVLGSIAYLAIWTAPSQPCGPYYAYVLGVGAFVKQDPEVYSTPALVFSFITVEPAMKGCFPHTAWLEASLTFCFAHTHHKTISGSERIIGKARFL